MSNHSTSITTSRTSENELSIYLIACGVLRPDIAAVLSDRGIKAQVTENYLEGGLHSDPPELRRRIQKAIDEAEGYDLIVLGYGICGRGTVGLRVRDIPLVIPKVHDCIALFLGSDRRYQEEFRKFPGTYYISAGWYDEKVQPKGVKCACGPREVDQQHREELATKYGADNAAAIVDFLTSWRRNYQRAVYIETGVSTKRRYESYAQAMAEEFGWKYEHIAGTHELLEKLFDLQRRHEEVLLVPPRHVTAYDAKRRALAAAWTEDAPAAGPASSGDGPAVTEEAPRHSIASGVAETAAGSETGYGAAPSGDAHLGLGIDAGGTYTDAVIFDFDSRAVLCSGKALTTKWDYSVGIMNAVDQLDSGLFSRIDLTAISTTLATNAIVEGKGQPVGLLLIPADFHDPGEIHHSPAIRLAGQLDISGRELEPIDPEEVREAVRRMVSEGVQAFAVSGYAASVNPSQELAVKEIIREESGMATCLGSELSDLLNFCVRANTAVLNARILPLLESFIADVERSLAARSIESPMMVVRGDGSLMTAAYAAEHPVETVMSGPAASVAGARYLTDADDALVVDVGGTTSDIGRIRDGSVAVCDAGSQVGHWRTHVRAVDMKTEGIGGDSEILFERRSLSVGPARVEPVSLLAGDHDLEPALHYLSEHKDDFAASTRPMTLLTRTDRLPRFELSSAEQVVYDLLSARPYSLKELAGAAGVGHWTLLRLSRLLDDYAVQGCGLTPTDLLHSTGQVALYDAESARRVTALYAEIAGWSPDEMVAAVFAEIRRGLVTAVLEKQLELDLATHPLGRSLVEKITEGSSPDVILSARLPMPFIGLGAAAPFLLGDAARVLGAELTIPPHAATANAVGAITSLVSVKKSVSIIASDIGTYLVQGLPGAPEHESLDEAYTYAVEALSSAVRTLARDAGTDEDAVTIELDDRMSETADGSPVFLERRVVASITGAPSSVDRIRNLAE